jgi:hypothetical protein
VPARQSQADDSYEIASAPGDLNVLITTPAKIAQELGWSLGGDIENRADCLVLAPPTSSGLPRAYRQMIDD